MDGHCIDDRTHSMLTHTEVHVAPFRSLRAESRFAIDPGLVGWRQVSRPTHQLGQRGSQAIDHLTGSSA